jgi:rhodanese-related sulfurtransferase
VTPSQIFLYAVVIAILFLYVRKVVISKSVPHYTPDEVANLINRQGGIVLLDVRTEKERRMQHIQGSEHIPLHQLDKRIGELQRHRRKKIICYCQTGSRSLTAAIRLKKHGFTVANLKGGIAEWNFVHRRV